MKDKISLFLDDVRSPSSHRWEVVKTYDQFVTQIRMHGLESYQIISLDHDLGTEMTGMDAAKFLVEESMAMNTPLPQIYVHSANPVGAANIIGYINAFLKNCGMPQNCIRVQISHTI
jgi:hypothetical protein